MKHGKKLALLLFWLSIAFLSRAQDEEKEPPQNRWFIGGNFGLTFGDYTLINVSPQLGYRFTDFFAAGAGVNMQYISIKRRVNGDPYYKSSRGVAGLNVFTRVYPIRMIMLQAQPEANYIFGKELYYNPRQEYKFDGRIVPSLLLGGGAVIPSGRGALIAGLFYDVLQHANSPYGRRPVVTFSYNIGL